MQQFKQKQKAAAWLAAAASESSPASKAGGSRSSSSKGHWQFCPAAVQAQQQGPRMFVADSPFADADAELARAVDWARKAYWSLFRVVSLTPWSHAHHTDIPPRAMARKLALKYGREFDKALPAMGLGLAL